WAAPVCRQRCVEQLLRRLRTLRCLDRDRLGGTGRGGCQQGGKHGQQADAAASIHGGNSGGKARIVAHPGAWLTIGTFTIWKFAIASRHGRTVATAGHRSRPAQVPARAELGRGGAGPARGAVPRRRADVRLPDREDPGALRRGRAERQAERAVSRAAQPGGRGLPGQPRRAVGCRAAATLLPDHRRRARRPARMGRRLARDPRLSRHRPGGDPMNTHLPRTIPEYLEQLRRALAGADPAMIQDALYDAEEYLRSELAENPGRSEAEVIAA